MLKIYSNDIPAAMHLANGRLYLVGSTSSSIAFPVSSSSAPFKQPDYTRDMFLLAFEPATGKRHWGGAYGSTRSDVANDVVVSGTNLKFVGLIEELGGVQKIIMAQFTDTPELQVELSGGANRICITGAVNVPLYANVTYGASSNYAWKYNGNAVGNSGNTFTATQPGRYTVTVDDGSGNTATDVFDLSIYLKPQLQINYDPRPGCGNNLPTAQITNALAGHTYSVCVTKPAPFGSTRCFNVTGSAAFNIPVTTSGTYTITVTDPASCVSCGTTAQLNYTQILVLGNPGVVTTFTGGQTFNGTYLVLGPLAFTNGVYNLEPGTKFYVDPEGGVDQATLQIEINAFEYTNCNGTLPTIIKVENAELNIKGAVLTVAECSQNACGGNGYWGGINVVNNGKVTSIAAATPANPTVKIDSEISFAVTAIGMCSGTWNGNWQMATSTNYYYLNDLHFYDNLRYGFQDIYKRADALPGEGIQNCRFERNKFRAVYLNDNNSLVISGTPGGNYSEAFYNDNYFSDSEYGFLGSGNYLSLYANTFVNNYYSVNVNPLDTARQNKVNGNNITVPGLPGATGVIVLNSQCQGNTVSGASISGNTGIINLGGCDINNNLIGTMENGIVNHSNANAGFIMNNNIRNCTVGVKVESWQFDQLQIEKNTFTDNLTGITFTEYNRNSAKAPLITCNTFSAPNVTGTSRAIYIPSGVTLGGGNELGRTGQGGVKLANGNRFESSIIQPVWNDNTITLRYNRADSQQEDLKTIAPGNNTQVFTDFSSIPVGYCGTFNEPGVFDLRVAKSTTKTQTSTTNHTGRINKEVLSQNYPNPAGTEVAIVYQLPENCKTAKLIICNVQNGREIKTLYLPLTPQENTTLIDVSVFANGVYAYTLYVDDKPVATKRLMVAK